MPQKLRCALVAGAAIIAATMLVACRVTRPANQHAQSQTLYTATTSDPRTYNPIIVTDTASGEAVRRLFEGLLDINPKTTLPEPDIAQRWEIAPDEKSITFYLRRDVKWFDGVPLTSRDVLFSLRVIYDPKIPNSIASSLMIDDKPLAADAIDDYTVRFKLARPFAPLLYAVGFPIIPEHVLKEQYQNGRFNQTWGVDTAADKMIGSGPYRLVQFEPSQSLQFLRYTNYWMKDEQGGQLPRLRGQTVLIVPDLNTAYLRFQSGQIDVYTPRAKEVNDLREKAKQLDITVKEIGIDTGSMFFAFNRNPRHYLKNGVTDPKLRWFTDLNFMRALAHSIDKKSMIDLSYYGLAEPAVAEISPANKIFHNPNLKDYEFDPRLAAELLEKAGYRLAKSGQRVDAQGNRIEFNLTTNTGNPEREQLCAIFKQDLEDLGIKVNYRPLEFTTLVEKLDSTFDWDVVLMGFTGTIEPNNGSNVLRSSGNLHLWDPRQPKPATKWEAEIDKLLEAGTAEMDPHKRAKFYWRIQEILHEQLPLLETVRQIRYTAYKNSLENYQPTVWGTYRQELMQFRAE